MANLPAHVVDEDRRRERLHEDAGRALVDWRWHWTINPDNPEGGYSFAEYARDVGRGPDTIERYAKARDILESRPRGRDSMTVSEAVRRSTMSAERTAAVEAVAEVTGRSFTAIAKGHEPAVTEEARAVRDETEKIVAENPDADFADTAKQVAAQRAFEKQEREAKAKKAAEAAAEREKRAKRQHTAAFVEADGILARMGKDADRLNELLNGVELTTDEADIIAERRAEVAAKVSNMDAEFAALLEGGAA